MATAQKIDLFKEHREEYATPKRPKLVNVGKGKYLTIRGKGEPGGEVFQTKIGALFSAAYTVKFTEKFDGGQDFKVAPLESLWWLGESCELPPEEWEWQLLIRVPDFITKRHLNRAVKTLLEKGKGPEVKEVTLEPLREGKCVQMLHVGPYSEEPATVEKMKAFAGEQGLTLQGPHHEIYLSDPRRCAPERLRTILRHPVA
jgi:hypothetical protein